MQCPEEFLPMALIATHVELMREGAWRLEGRAREKELKR